MRTVMEVTPRGPKYYVISQGQPGKACAAIQAHGCIAGDDDGVNEIPAVELNLLGLPGPATELTTDQAAGMGLALLQAVCEASNSTMDEVLDQATENIHAVREEENND